MKLFKESKKQPLKIGGYKYIGFSKYQPHVCYYYKELPRDNFELLTCSLEANKKGKPELGAGTNIKVVDVFMSSFLYNLKNDINYRSVSTFVKNVINTSFKDLKDDEKEYMIKKYSASIPTDIKKFNSYKEACKDNYRVLYCSNDESEDRKFAIVNLVMAKEVIIDSKELDIHSTYIHFKPLKFMVSPAYLKGLSKTKYREEKLQEIVVDYETLV